uniref:Uncharacterized protein n=1 Tax=Sus scrofa TaxID=9823 RepID=A0A8D1D690_PIG
TLDFAGRREGLPCPPRGSPPSGTPSADPENKAQRSGPVGERDLKARLLPEEVRLPPANRVPALGYFRCGSAPPPRAREELGLTLSSPESRGGERLVAPPHSVGLFASGFACYLHERSTLPHPFRIPLFLHPTPQSPEAPSRARQKDREATLLLVYCPSAGSGSQGPGWGCPAQPAGLYSVCRGAVRPLQGNELSGMSRSLGLGRPGSWETWAGRGHAAGPVGPVGQRSDVERGGGGQRGSSRGRGRRLPRAPSAQHSPLEDAGVLAAQRDEVRVVVREPDAGHVAAVTAVHEARRLGRREGRAAAAVEPQGPDLPSPEALGGLSPWRARTGTGRGALCRSRRPQPPRAHCGNGTGS